MGESPKKETKPLPPEKAESSGTPALFSSPNSFSLFLCASAIVLMGGALFYAAMRPAPMRLADVTRSPLGFDVEEIEAKQEEEPPPLQPFSEPLLAYAQQPMSSSSTSTSTHSTSPTQIPTQAPAIKPMRTRKKPSHSDLPPLPYEDSQIHDEDVDEESPRAVASGPEFYQRVEMLEQEIHQLRTVLAQRERMIAQLSRELTESRARPPVIAMETPPLPLEPVSQKTALAARFHTVQKGETLSEIAQRYYGNRTAWIKIYRANTEKLPDKNRLPVGVVLNIPE